MQSSPLRASRAASTATGKSAAYCSASASTASRVSRRPSRCGRRARSCRRCGSRRSRARRPWGARRRPAAGSAASSSASSATRRGRRALTGPMLPSRGASPWPSPRPFLRAARRRAEPAGGRAAPSLGPPGPCSPPWSPAPGTRPSRAARRPSRARAVLQLALLALAGAACATWLYGPSRRPSASRLGWAGIGLLALFAAWCGRRAAGGAWRPTAPGPRSTARWPTPSPRCSGSGWVPRSRARPRARARGSRSLGGVVALYALGAKTVPGLAVGGLLDLDQRGRAQPAAGAPRRPRRARRPLRPDRPPGARRGLDRERRGPIRLLALCAPRPAPRLPRAHVLAQRGARAPRRSGRGALARAGAAARRSPTSPWPCWPRPVRSPSP